MRITAALFLLLFLFRTGRAEDNDTLKYYDASLFPLIGKGFPDTENRYERLPFRLKEVTRGPVWSLSTNCSGMAVRFRSNSRVIAVNWEVTKDVVMNHFTPTGIKGLDLYCLVNGKWQFVNSARPSGKSSKAVIISNMSPQQREFLLYLPLYDGLFHLDIGIESGATIGVPLIDSPRRDKPVVFYGTSITQGGCATRAGMAYPNILSRMLDREIINLGFSGNGKLDYEIAEVMTEIDASCYVIDCLPNVTDQLMKEKYEHFIDILRKKRPDVPILLVENILYPHMVFDQKVNFTIKEKNTLLRNIWRTRKKLGDKNLYYAEAEGIIGIDQEGTVDGVHLTDLGFLRMSQNLYPEIRKLIK